VAKGFWDDSPDKKKSASIALSRSACGCCSVSSAFLKDGGTSQVNILAVRSQGDGEDDLFFLTASACGMNQTEEGSNLRLLSESQTNLAGCSVASGLKDGTMKEEPLSEDAKAFLSRVEKLHGPSHKNKQKTVVDVCTVCSFCGPTHPSRMIVFVGGC
jgi:hypothetical protein